METYSFLRELADSWGLLAMFAFFVGMIVWVFLPGNRDGQDDAASIPFRNEDKPAPEKGAASET